MQYLIFLFGFFLCGSLSVSAQIYSYVNEDGQTVYTDSPPNGVKTKKLEVKTVNQTQVDNDLKKQSDTYFSNQAAKRQASKDAAEQKKREKKMQDRVAKKVKKQLDAAKQIRPGDLAPNKNGGFRYTDQYKKRLADAEKAVNDSMKKETRNERKEVAH